MVGGGRYACVVLKCMGGVVGNSCWSRPSVHPSSSAVGDPGERGVVVAGNRGEEEGED